MRTVRNIVKDEVIVKLTPKGERAYTMNSTVRETLTTDHIYSFSIQEFLNIFGKEGEDLFEDNKLVFPDPNRYYLEE